MKFIHTKKIIIAVLLLSLLSVGVSQVAFANSPTSRTSVGDSGTQPGTRVGDSSGRTFTLSNPLSNVNSIGALVNKFVEILSYILIIFAVLMIVYTGLQFILARGNPEKMKEEGKRLGYILIGVALVIGARILVMVVINTLQATGTVNPQVIKQANQAVQGR